MTVSTCVRNSKAEGHLQIEVYLLNLIHNYRKQIVKSESSVTAKSVHGKAI